MAWLVIAFSVVVLWVASLFKILQESFFASKATFLNDGGVIRRRNVLLVIAHPDDESMFFAPTINYLISKGQNLHVLCMSTGNAEGKGNIRKEELYLASAILKRYTELERNGGGSDIRSPECNFKNRGGAFLPFKRSSVVTVREEKRAAVFPIPSLSLSPPVAQSQSFCC